MLVVALLPFSSAVLKHTCQVFVGCSFCCSSAFVSLNILHVLNVLEFFEQWAVKQYLLSLDVAKRRPWSMSGVVLFLLSSFVPTWLGGATHARLGFLVLVADYLAKQYPQEQRPPPHGAFLRDGL
jgi:hypothetical protein